MTDESQLAGEPMSAVTTGDLASRGTAQSLALGFAGVEGAWAMRAPFRPDLVGDPDEGGLANGGITTLLDQTCGMAVSGAGRPPGGDPETQRRFGTMATLDFRIDFIRPAKPGRDVVAEARCYSIAGGVAFVRGFAF